MSVDPTSLRPARFVTFYSFKGGVGRSMALINVAGILAGRGFRVIVIDLDLEAPGISYLLRSHDADPSTTRPGWIDLLTEAIADPEQCDLFNLPPAAVVERYSHAYELPEALKRGSGGELRIMPAGRLDGQYQRRLDDLDLSGLYKAGDGKSLVLQFKQVVRDAAWADFVFIDSRTGFSDESGICTRDLADHVVVVTGLNQQNVQGTASFLRALHRATDGERSLQFVFSPIPIGEDQLVEERERAATLAFTEAWGRSVDLLTRIYYHPRLALTEEPHVFRASRGLLYDAYVALERTVLRALGLRVEQLQKQFKEAIDAKQFTRALELLPLLVKFDDTGGSSWGAIIRLLWQERASPGVEPLYAYVAENAPLRAVDEGSVAFELHQCGYLTAELFYKRALAVDPRGIVSLHWYAKFLHEVRGDIVEADKYYKEVLSVIDDLRSDEFLWEYGNFLRDVKGDLEGAEIYYQKVLGDRPEDSYYLGTYAVYLQDMKGDFEEAERYFRQALQIEPDSPYWLAGCARLLFACGRSLEASAYLRRALVLLDRDTDVLQYELYFCAYAHAREQWPDALSRLKCLVSGDTWPPLRLAANVERARADGHPEPELLAALARVLANEAPIDTLDAFPAWQQAG